MSNTDSFIPQTQPSFFKTLYFKGIFWFILSLLISNSNDLIMKFLGQNLPSVEITFWRFFFGTLSLIPVMLYFGKSSWRTSRPFVHVIRGSLLFVGISFWCYGLTIVPIATVTVLNFSIPLFILVLARIFLKEQIGWQRCAATIAGFFGIVAVLNPTEIGFQPIALVLVAASLMFATLDIINKKFIIQESMLSMLFYSAFVATILSAFPTYFVWTTPSFQQLGVLAILGVGGNLILFCLLKAFAAMDASALAPFRYFELVISILFGFLFFQEFPGLSTVIGAAIIIPSTLFVARYEFYRERSSRLNPNKDVLESEKSTL
ncbi:MAG: DMT family transporter [Proteobacteria bacterium]|nr:DMT family transporter [Pseudomonadota bacterium]